ncbi:thioesterase II family protein [Nocardia amikacinitolerans]|uniref:thioesterase II family protein n=1 Tax=Nocardia amikacinitolerans TaxID=756689 RepID=UPI0036BC14F8
MNERQGGAVGVSTTAPLPNGHRGVLTCPRPQASPAIRLVCFAHSGGNPRMFQPWVDQLAPEIELWWVTLPGRGPRWREPHARAWEPLVADIAGAVVAHVPRPVALFGHSLGALLAFDVALRLTDAGLPPEHVFVSARAHPRRQFTLDLPEDDTEMLRLIDRVYRGVPEAILDSPELAEHFAPTLRADLMLGADYRYRGAGTLSVPITALGGVDDLMTPTEELAAWQDRTTATARWRQFPGGHFYLDESEAGVLRTIRRTLAAPMGKGAER